MGIFIVVVLFYKDLEVGSYNSFPISDPFHYKEHRVLEVAEENWIKRGSILLAKQTK